MAKNPTKFPFNFYEDNLVNAIGQLNQLMEEMRHYKCSGGLLFDINGNWSGFGRRINKNKMFNLNNIWKSSGSLELLHPRDWLKELPSTQSIIFGKTVKQTGDTYRSPVAAAASYASFLVHTIRNRIDSAMLTYFIQPEIGGLIKIGKSTQLVERYKQLLAVIYGDHESKIHDLFRNYRKHGEWFESSKEITDFIENIRIDHEDEYCRGKKILEWYDV